MKNNNKKGFTLVELVIVVAVMAILVAVAIPTVSSITNKAQTAVDESNCRTIESVIKLKEAELSNENNSGSSIGGDDIIEAINDAKLGIVDETYYYVTDTGIVSTEAGDIEIVFDENGVAALG